MSTLSLPEARRIFGDDLIEPGMLGRLLGEPPPGNPAATSIPFTVAAAEAAHAAGCVLLYRPDRAADGRELTLSLLAERCAGQGDTSLRFRGDEPWFQAQPFATGERPQAGWALVFREPWRETLNQTYERGAAALRARGGATGWRRRRAVEIAFDCLAMASLRRVRLLERAWDWSSTAAADDGLVNVGGFGAGGLEVLCYSRAVKHGALGICPTLVGTSAS